MAEVLKKTDLGSFHGLQMADITLRVNMKPTILQSKSLFNTCVKNKSEYIGLNYIYFIHFSITVYLIQ